MTLRLLAPPPPPGAMPADRPATLSVLVPAYQAAATIGEALESALSQHPEPHEVIVSDDGSEDDLDDVLRTFGDRIVVVRGPNGGLAVARNRAAAVATGEVLVLLDADDVWLPGRAAALVDAARARPDLDILTTDAFMIRDGVREEGTYYGVRGWPTGDQIDAILRENFIFGAGAVRRRAFERVGGYDGTVRYAEDWDLWLRLLTSGSRAGLVDAPLYEYRRRSGSLTADRLRLALGVLGNLDRARRLPLSGAQRQILRRTTSQWRVRAATAASAAGDRRRYALTARAVIAPHVSLADRARTARAAMRSGT